MVECLGDGWKPRKMKPSNVTHLNEMLNKLQEQHQIRIDYLEKKIIECEGEIQQLKSFIKSK